MTVLGVLTYMTMLGFVAFVGFVTFMATVGDALLTLAARKFGSDYVGDKFALKWSLREGTFEVKTIVLGKTVREMVAPMLGMPMDVEKITLDQFLIVVPLVGRFFGGKKPLQSTVQIAGLQLGLSVNNAEKWAWMKEDNIARYQQAVKDAAKARLARADALTTVIVQKLKDLAALRKARQEAKKKKPQPKQEAKDKPETAPAAWQVLVDEVIDSFAIVIRSFAVTIRDDHSATGIGVAMEKFEIGRSHADGERRKRQIQLVDFEVFLNTSARTTRVCPLIKPMSMEIGLFMPYVLQSLVLQQIDERRALEVEISFPSDVIIQVRPAQLSKVMKFLRPLSFYSDWHHRAMCLDESACVDLIHAQREEYIRLYKEQWKLDNETGFIARMIANYQEKEEIATRKARLDELEAKLLTSRILLLRSIALDWTVPSGGAALPQASKDMKRQRDLKVFLEKPLDAYEKPVEVGPPMFHVFVLGFYMRNTEVQLFGDSGQEMMSTFVNDMTLSVDYTLEPVEATNKAMCVELTIRRFGLLDEREAPTNVFRRLLDRNLDASKLLDVQVEQLGNGHLDIQLNLEKFTLLAVFDPLLYTMNTFMAALEEDEATQMRFLEYSVVSAAVSAEQQEGVWPVYAEEIPNEYSPLLIGGSSLNCQLVMTRCEICLLGDSSSVKSHVLAFTSDMTVRVASSSRHEAIEVELVDVALQPCSIVITEDGIDLEMAGLRTILELEGDGVDLHLGYKLVVGDSKSQQASSTSLVKSDGEGPRAGANLWKMARTAVAKKQIAEVDHDALLTAEEETAHATGRNKRLKPGARRKLVLNMSDFAMNLSANDLGVFLSIIGSLNDSMKEDVAVVKARLDRDERLVAARKELREHHYMERLKAEFRLRDADGGGSLDAEEIESLIKSVANCENLTKEEFNQTVREFISIVDRDGSGDISLEEFEGVLSRQKTVYHRLHHGVVTLTGREYVDPTRPRSSVPALYQHSNSMANAAALLSFWERYESEVGASRTSLNGMSPTIVQKKMVRTFKNYEYAQEAWNRLVNPSLIKPTEKSIWLLTKGMDMGGRGDVIDQLLSSFEEKDAEPEGTKQHLHMFIHTIVSTSFGGFYLRLIDETLPMGVPSIEVSLEELVVYANFSVWEGELPDATADVKVRQRTQNDFGVAKVNFAVYGKYYNANARQVEPFLEYYQGTLDVRKDPETHTDIVFTSDRYFQLNVTFVFMEVVKANLATFSKVERLAAKERSHIKEEGGLFWMLNDTGLNIKYAVVAKKNVKDRVRVETVTAVSSVPHGEAHPCVLLTVDDEMRDYEQQSLKEKQLRQAFRNADADGSGELDAEEVRTVLMEVYAEEAKYRKPVNSRDSASTVRSDSAMTNDSDLDTLVEDFIALADTDGSGQVSWEEFKVAISKSRETVDRFISIQVEGYEPLDDVPISSFGYTQVYELTPYFEEVEMETSISVLYQEGVTLLNQSNNPSRRDLQKAYACLRRVKEMNATYEWIDSYYAECERVYLPTLVAVHISVDGLLGLQVNVSGAERLQNNTSKPTECLLLDGNHEVDSVNPARNDSKERYFTLPPNGSISIPLNLADVGYFAIRQIGETEWSNELPLSVRDQRLFKRLTGFEQRELKRILRDNSSTSLSTVTAMVKKMGKDFAMPDPNSFVAPGKEVVYPSASFIDNQPTLVIEKISVNDSRLGTWSLVIQPQLILHNVLPCGIEYVIVQPRDCPDEMLDSKGGFRVVSGSKNSRSVKMLGEIDYFKYVNEVNCRRLYVESGKTAQVFGLDLDSPALMKLRLCASESNRAARWSPIFQVNLNASRSAFNSEVFELRFDDGPCVVFQQQWPGNTARSVILYAPYWIQNRSGIDFRFKLPKGDVCSIEQHRAYFNSDKEVPVLANAPTEKAMFSIRPYQETPQSYSTEFFASPKTKKYLPDFARAEWSEAHDMASVGTKGELRPSGSGDYSFVVAFEVLAAPGQFFRSKIFRITPRYVIVNRVPRPLQVTPVMLDKKFTGIRPGKDGSALNVGLKENYAVAVYRFIGGEKNAVGLRLRDVYKDEALPDVGEWSPNMPIKSGDDCTVWTRGALGDGPACTVAFQNFEETIYTTISDASTSPKYRIENRSTQFAFRYVQVGVKGAEEIVIKPQESHSFVWDNPLLENRRLKVIPVNWKIPTEIDLKRIGHGPKLTATGLYSEVYIDGSTRVFAVGDTPNYWMDRMQVNDWLSNTLIDVALHGFGLTIVDGHPQEVLNLTMETIRFSSSVNSRKCVFSLHHMQIDDMTSGSLYPVVFAPLDSGFNSDKREGWLPDDGERPFFSLSIETLPQAGVTIVDEFDLQLNSMSVKLNLEYILGVVNLLLEFIPTSDEETIAQQGIDHKNLILSLELNVPELATHGGLLMYFKEWRMRPYDFFLVFDSSAEDRGEGISSILGSTIGSIVGGIAHITPEFHFGEIRFENRFFYEYDLLGEVIWSTVLSVIRQWYKIVGSVELLGDPVGLATDIVDGFALAARQLKRDVRGKSLRKGESALTLMQTVIGAPMGSIGKISNGLGDVVKKVTDFESQEEADQPRHLPEGLLQSGVVFTKSVAHGFKGFVKEPVRGAKKGGVKGFAKGVGRGTLQLVASPVVGTLGVVEKLTQSVHNTTHLLDAKSFEGTRRPARDLDESPLKALSDSNVITEVELHVLYVEGLPENSNPKVLVRVYNQPKGNPAREIARYKSTTLRHTTTPKFDQSWLIGITSSDTVIEIHVHHKRPPLAKKSLGFVRFSMEDIYREFEGVPAQILADSKAKLRLKKRKRVKGSILNDIAHNSSQALEVRDESWRQKMGRSSMENFLSEEMNDDDSDDYENDSSLLLSSQSIKVDPSYPIHPVGIPLTNSATGAKIFLSVRYVNDMRRYA
ncbi:hypothetical protein Poli38472_004260 [Pythium oligandrum]|uniref:Calmodulin n=1 Tax=Pythium oligandrum TaxID=41045 RepID=A0A8K1FJW6_PYTOL|nr:hypothetical protein Poli38472_004260 [Pythium oligandrum]|eukprot:TMW66495.1 hypothetical protein Poli38472_004260 [Pythium oligandrum]